MKLFCLIKRECMECGCSLGLMSATPYMAETMRVSHGYCQKDFAKAMKEIDNMQVEEITANPRH